MSVSGPTVMLVDNGSTRAASTVSLRRIAAALTEQAGRPVHPVSILHSDRVPAADLDGETAQIFSGFLRWQLAAGQREFVVLPLFFGRSRALTAFIPEEAEKLAAEFGAFTLRVADPLVPLPAGEPRLAALLADHVAVCEQTLGCPADQVLVVDHGSPVARVTAVRDRVVADLRGLLTPGTGLSAAVMERRDGPEYDFNGPLLADALDGLAALAGTVHVALAMLFLSPGRHAGPGGDIAEICAAAMQRNPGLQVAISPLVGEHPLLVEILAARLREAR